MFRQVVGFELRYQLRQPLLWAVAATFAVLSFIATITDALAIGGAIGSLNRNAPYIVVRMLGELSVIGVFIVVAFVATSVLRDFECGTDEIVFSRPVRSRDLLLGRFVGSVIAACGCFAAAAVGLFAGSLMPWLEPERVGAIDARPYLFGLAVLAWPTFVILGGLMFALASRVRKVSAVYVVLVGLLVAYFAASAMFTDLESRTWAALLDPFGLNAFGLETRYWTIAEKNTILPSVAGPLGWNRLLWLTIGVAALGWAVASFRYDRAAGRRRRPAALAERVTPAGIASMRWLRERPAFTSATARAQFASQFTLESRSIVGGLPFLIILAFGLINVLANIGYLDLMMGTPVWPVTHLMLLAISAGYAFLLNIIITFYAGELVWRERNLRFDGVTGALPVPTWIFVVAKVAALWVACGVFIAAGIVALMGYQLFQGYTHLEPWLYAQGFALQVVPFLLTACLALFFQVVANQKFVGYLLMVVYLISDGALSALHFNHHLYRFATAPSAPYSDMNRWGHFAVAVAWFDAYWAFAAGVLLCLAAAAWVRGYDSKWTARLRMTRAHLGGATLAITLALLAGLAGTGGFIYYNTNVLNAYQSSEENERWQADYERKFQRYRDVPQPRVVSVHADIDIFPRERRADIRGVYRLANHTAAPITTLHISTARRVKVLDIVLPPHRVVLDDKRLSYAIYELAMPLAPGQEIDFGFHLEISNPGFVNSDADTSVVENGTFFHTRQLPSIGYLDYRELGDPSQRRRQGLPPLARMASMDDRKAREQNDLARDADWLTFGATVSTDPDQIALAPGHLEREWTDGGRRYFRYRMQAPIPKFFAFLSARYAVRHDTFQGVDISVFHHPGHEYNVDRMMDAVKKTLRYMTENFSPYQDRQVRIAEFPRYARLAGSFPSLTPFSESIGFIARLRDADDIDYPFYVTAHEIAHQWWGYQVLAADVQGAQMLSETMAQYSALMVMQKEYGPEKMRRFLKYELDRYLSGRGGELIEEMPLELVEDQPYIHYSKGSLVMYALQDAIGEARLNDALRRYLESVRFQKPPYTISRDLVAFIADATPPEKRSLLDDLFTSITLFDNRVVSAESRPLGGNRYEVTVRATARKLRSDGKGVESDVPLDDWIDVGIFGKDAASDGAHGRMPLYLQKQHVVGSDVTVTATVAGVPVRAGIDPYNILIDRTPSDNVRAVSPH